MSDFCKKPCKHCPFRNDVRPFLHPDRAEEIGMATTNPYMSFPCHKTTESDEDGIEMHEVSTSLQCAGMLTLRANEGLPTPEGFEPSFEICYTDSFEMVQAYQEEWDEQRRK